MKKKGNAPTPVTRPVRAAAVSACNIEGRSYHEGRSRYPGTVVTAYLALGSNLGDRRAFLHAAAVALDRLAGARVRARATSTRQFPRETLRNRST